MYSLQSRLHALLADSSQGREADTRSAGAFVPPVDIYEDADHIVLTLEVAGVNEEAFDISVKNNTLHVRGERKWQNEQKEENFHRVERRYGSFHRAFTLPQTVDAGHVSAGYDAGVLRIELAKRPEMKSRRIPVQVGPAATPVAQVEAPVA